MNVLLAEMKRSLMELVSIGMITLFIFDIVNIRILVCIADLYTLVERS